MNIANLKFSVISGLIVTLITSFQAIVIAPILISSVGSSVYGAWIIVADVLIALQMFDFGITAYGAQKIASARANDENHECCANFFATMTIVIGLVILLNMLCIFVLLRYEFPAELSHASQYILRNCAVIGIVSVSLQLLSYSFIAPSRALESLTVINVSSVCGALVGFLLTLVLLKMNFGLYSVAYGMLIRSFLNLIGGVFSVYFLRSITGVQNFDRRKYTAAVLDQIKNAPSTFIGNFSLLAISASENFLVGRFVGLSEVANYSISRKIFDFCKTVIDIFSYSAYGGLSVGLAKLSRNSQSTYLHKYTIGVLIVSASLIIPAYAFSSIFVTLWVGVDKYVGASVAGLMAMAAFVSCISGFLFSGLRAQGRFKMATVNVTAELVFKLGIAIVFLPLIGISGMPLASIGGSIFAIIIAICMTGKNAFLRQLTDRAMDVIFLIAAGILAYLSHLDFGLIPTYIFQIGCVALSALAFKAAYKKN